MKKVILPALTLIGLITITTLFISCEKENNVQQDEISTLDVPKFKSNFPELFLKINKNYTQKTKLNSKNSKSNENTMQGITFPVMDNDRVIGRYMGLSDESSAVYMDFSDYTEKVTIYDVNDPSKFEVIKMIYNKDTNEYLPSLNNSKDYFWCDASCTVGALAIAASDGPVPAMDILAVSYQLTCMAACRA